MTSKNELYSCPELIKIPVGESREILFRPDNGAIAVLPCDAGAVLEDCGAWRPLSDHASAMAETYARNEDASRGDAFDANQIEAALSGLAARRLLASRDEFSMQLNSRTENKLSTLGVITADRPALLERCLESFASHRDSVERRYEYIVFDDSRRPESVHAIRSCIDRLASKEEQSIRYAGRSEKEDFAARLSRESGVPSEIIRFGILGPPSFGNTVGSNRNALLLDCAGSPVVSCDDDVVGQFASAPGIFDTPVFSRDEAMLEFSFFESIDAALSAASPRDFDVMAMHEKYIGRQAGVWLPDRTEPRATATELTRFGRKRVVATFTGILGDNAYDRPTLYLLLGGSSRNRLLSSEKTYRDAIRSRQILRVVSKPTLSDHVFNTSTLIGLDGSVLLPPFFPAFRNQDGLFSWLIRRAMPEYMFAHLPFAALHAPHPIREHPLTDPVWSAPESISFSGLLAAVLDLGPEIPLGARANEGLVSLGRHLLLLSRLKSEDFAAAVRPTILKKVSAYVGLIDEMLNVNGCAPDFWAEDLCKHREFLLSAIQAPDYFVPRELLERWPAEIAAVAAQELIGQYGRLLECWPRLWECSKESMQGEERLSGVIQ